MGLKSSKILGISVTTDSKEDILEYIQKYLEKSSEKQKEPLVIVTPNPEQIVMAQKDSHFAKILNQADVAIPDGQGLALAARLKRIPGVEFLEDLVALAAKRGYAIGLIGGRGGVAVRALECLSRRAGIKGWAIEPEGKTIEEVTKKIVDSNTRLVFVGLGAPKQEYFIENAKCQMPNAKYPLILMSVGGAFDMISGRTPRAPHAVRVVGLEWLWRLVREPWRFRRQLALLKFLWLLASKGLTF